MPNPKWLMPTNVGDFVRSLVEEKPGYATGNVLPLRIPEPQDNSDPLTRQMRPQRKGAARLLDLAPALPTSAGDFVRGVVDMLEGRKQGEMLTPNALGALVGGPMAAARPSGSLGMFGGRLAKTADRAKLSEAMSMNSRGAEWGDIWKKTGWFKDVDGRWKFEISDADAKLKTELLGKNQYDQSLVTLPLMEAPIPLRDVIDHQKLFEAYPSLGDIPVRSTIGFGNLGSFDPEKNAIQLAGGRPSQVLSTTLHEGQHAIQHLEDFALGGNTGMFMPKDFDEKFGSTLKRVDEIWDEIFERGGSALGIEGALKKKLEKTPLSSSDIGYLDMLSGLNVEKELIDIYPKVYEAKKIQDSAYESYKHLAGEAEARNVQARAPKQSEFGQAAHVAHDMMDKLRSEHGYDVVRQPDKTLKIRDRNWKLIDPSKMPSEAKQLFDQIQLMESGQGSKLPPWITQDVETKNLIVRREDKP